MQLFTRLNTNLKFVIQYIHEVIIKVSFSFFQFQTLIKYWVIKQILFSACCSLSISSYSSWSSHLFYQFSTFELWIIYHYLPFPAALVSYYASAATVVCFALFHPRYINLPTIPGRNSVLQIPVNSIKI